MESNEQKSAAVTAKKDTAYDQWKVLQDHFESRIVTTGWMVMNGCSEDLLTQYRVELQALHAAKETLAALLDEGAAR